MKPAPDARPPTPPASAVEPTPVAKIVSTTVNNTVGYGITSEPQHPNKVKARKLRALWDSFASSVDVHDHRRLDWYGIQQLAMRAIVESGGVLLLEMTDSRGLHVRVLEQDYIDRSKGVQGVEYGPRGPQFYWLYDAHPGDSDRASTASSRYPAERVAHIYRIDRPGQNAGITWLAPVVLELHDLDGMEDATLLKQKTAACFGGFNETTGGACKISILKAQLLATAKQFDEVTTVTVQPPTVFQP